MQRREPPEKGVLARLLRPLSDSVRNILAIAGMTFKDGIRKRALFTIVLFAILVVVSGFLPWVRPDFRIQQMTRICLGGIAFFGMVVAIFLASPNLPDDISRKTIFTVLTKPARRWHILAGKILGLAYILAIMLVIMGAMSYAHIRFWDWKMGAEPGNLPRLQGHKRTYATAVEYRDRILKVSEPIIKSERAIASGFERITFHFRGLENERFRGDTVFCEIVLFSHGFSYVDGEGTGLFQAKNPSTGAVVTEVFGAETLQPKHVGFPRAMIDANGDVSLTLITRHEQASYSAMASSVAVLSQPSGYVVNFAKALALMYMQYMVLVFIATAASTFLTSTVSVITALFVYFTGSFTEVLRGQALRLGTVTNIFTMAEHTHGPKAGIETAHALQLGINYLLRYFYLGISIAFPNLPAFSPTDKMAASEYISLAMLRDGLVYGLVYAGISFLVAWAVFRRKEVA